MRVKFIIVIMLLLNYCTASAVKNNFIFQKKSSCGTSNPLHSYDCSQATTDTNTCCYYTYGSQTGCFFLGNNYNGSYKIDGLSVYCPSNIINTISLVLLLIVIL